MGAHRGGAGEVPGAVKTLEKALLLLEALARRQPVGVVALARELGIPKSRTSRFLNTFLRRGYAARRPADGCFLLGPKALELAGAALAGKMLADAQVKRSGRAGRDRRKSRARGYR